MGPPFPTSLSAYRRSGLFWRLWWGVRRNALEKARAARVDSDVEAALRNTGQLSRTWGLGLVVAALITGVNVWALGRPFDLASTWTVLALVAGQVGGFFALKRSNETRAYLGEVRAMVHELSARSILQAAIGHSREIGDCVDTEELRGRGQAILRHLHDSRLFPKSVNAFSVWARDDGGRVWRIVAALGASADTVATFTQPVLAQETNGAGVVANLAITADRNASYYQRSTASAPNAWFKPDPSAVEKTETLAVFLLPDDAGVPVGAFALTSAQTDALECDPDGKPPERLSLIIEQCTLTLVGVARRAHEMWKAERHDQP